MTTQSRPNILKAIGIEKAFYTPEKVHILRGINLEVNRGDTVAITGRSGQGKSTLLQVLGTLETPCEGTLEIAQKTVRSTTKSIIRNKHIAFIFQSFHLLEDYTALENVLMPARIARQDVSVGAPAYKRGIELLEQVGLSDRLYFHTKVLSGGEKQRVAIARALCNDPDLILADEPSGNLDKLTSKAIHELLMNFVKKGDKSLIVVTHDPELAGMCTTEYNLSDGLLHQMR